MLSSVALLMILLVCSWFLRRLASHPSTYICLAV
jgi:hypothetical protein